MIPLKLSNRGATEPTMKRIARVCVAVLLF